MYGDSGEQSGLGPLFSDSQQQRCVAAAGERSAGWDEMLSAAVFLRLCLL